MFKGLLIGLILVIGENGLAQENKRWSFGAQIGLNATLIKFETLRVQPGINPTIGLCVDYQINNRFYTQAELNYFLSRSQSKYRKYYSSDTYRDFGMKTSIQYVSLPISFNYKLPLFKDKFWLGIGSELKYALDSKVRPSSTFVTQTSATTVARGSVDIRENTDFILFSPFLQVTMDVLQTKRSFLRASLRYSVSVNDPIQHSAPPEIVYYYQVQFNANRLHSFALIFNFISRKTE